ncbi:MAG: hypothetical protein HS101_07945 [Planctomycetia bacterium]|nr:hypothetical protein [Planctomycetia bacterium]
MTAELNAKQLRSLVETCATHSPGIIRGLTERTVNAILACDSPLSPDEDVAGTIRQTIETFRFMIRPRYFEMLQQTQIQVFREPICNAIADPQTQTIIIFKGLLEAMAFRLEASYLISALRHQLPKLTELGIMTERVYKENAVRAVLLPIHFLRNGGQLPRIVDKLNPDIQRDATLGHGGMLQFVLFHELGHLALNHYKSDSALHEQTLPFLACSESMNSQKAQEFEADQFAYDAIVPEARPAFIVFVWTALKLFSEFEFLSGDGPMDHPFTINRISRLNRLAGVLDDPHIGHHARKIFDSDLTLMQARIGQKTSAEDAIPPPLMSEINRQALYRTIVDEHQCRMALDNLLQAYQATCD